MLDKKFGIDGFTYALLLLMNQCQYLQMMLFYLNTIKKVFQKLTIQVHNLKFRINPNLSWLFRGWFCGGKVTSPCLTLVRIIPETLARKYTHICSFRKYTFQFQEPVNFAGISTFCKKRSTFTQSNSVRAVLEIFYFCFQFL